MWEERLHSRLPMLESAPGSARPCAHRRSSGAPCGSPGWRAGTTRLGDRAAISERSGAELRDRSDAHDPGGERPGLLAQLGDGRRLPDVAAPERAEGEEMSARPEDRAVGIGGETHSQAARACEPGGGRRGKERRAGLVEPGGGTHAIDDPLAADLHGFAGTALAVADQRRFWLDGEGDDATGVDR